MFLIKWLFNLALMGGAVALYVVNPPLSDFEERVRSEIKSDQSFLRKGAGVLKDITGITRLEQATGAKAHEVCRWNFYVGSVYVMRKSSMTESDLPLAVGLGIGGKIFLQKLAKDDRIAPYVQKLTFTDCKSMLMS